MLPLLIALVPANIDNLRPRHCDQAELNQFYDESGTPVLRQWIFWQWDRFRQKFVVREWSLSKPHQQVRPMRIGGRLLIPLYDAKHGLRIIEPGHYEKTWTNYDPEVENREVLPQEQRIPISDRRRR